MLAKRELMKRNSPGFVVLTAVMYVNLPWETTSMLPKVVQKSPEEKTMNSHGNPSWKTRD
jgi:hypothetical protein